MPALAWLVACTGKLGGGGGGIGLLGPTLLLLIVIESRLGGYVGEDLNGWAATGVWLAGVRAGAPCASPDVWTDGSLVRDKFSGVCCGGAGFFLFPQVLAGFIDLVGIWNCFRLISTLGLRGLCYFSRCLDLCKLSNVLSFGGLSLRCRHLDLYILVLTTPMWLDMLVGFLLVENLIDHWSFFGRWRFDCAGSKAG